MEWETVFVEDSRSTAGRCLFQDSAAISPDDRNILGVAPMFYSGTSAAKADLVKPLYVAAKAATHKAFLVEIPVGAEFVTGKAFNLQAG